MNSLNTSQPHLLHSLIFRSLKRSHDFFESNHGFVADMSNDEAYKRKIMLKAKDQYNVKPSNENKIECSKDIIIYEGDQKVEGAVIPLPEPKSRKSETENDDMKNKEIVIHKKVRTTPKPEWHAPWKLCRVISGHTGWVRCICFSPDNDYFITGADDRLLKIWDFQTGKLRLSLTGHISGVRGVKISDRHPYVFSCGEDKTVKCWDLEQNKVIRHYHGHTSAVYSLDIHPELDIVVTGGRDSVVRVWDMRTKANVHVLQGHNDAVAAVKCQAELPDIISAAHDSTVRLWDLKYAKTRSVLTNHKKAVRAIALHPTSAHLLAASADAIKQFALPDGNFVQNLRGHNTIINAVAINEHDVAVSGGNDGSLHFWDWRSGYNFQRLQTIPQSGSLDAENSILGMSFDRTSSRLVTVEGDKSIKFYKEDETATEESHPLQWRPNIIKKNVF